MRENGLVHGDCRVKRPARLSAAPFVELRAAQASGLEGSSCCQSVAQTAAQNMLRKHAETPRQRLCNVRRAQHQSRGLDVPPPTGRSWRLQIDPGSLLSGETGDRIHVIYGGGKRGVTAVTLNRAPSHDLLWH